MGDLYDWESKPTNVYLDVPEDLIIHYDEIDENTESWGTTTVIDPPNKQIVIENGDGSSIIIELDTDDDPSTPIEYTTNEFAIDCGEVLPVNSSFLSTFCNSSKYNPIVSLTESNGNNIDNEIKFNRIKIYPNPTRDILNVEIINHENVEFELRNIMGEIIVRKDAEDQNVIDLSGYTSGIYLIRIIENQKVLRDEKIIKI